MRLRNFRVPDSVIALAMFSLEGEDVSVHYRPVIDVIQPPRRQVAAALRMLAEHFDNEANEVEGAGR